MRDERGQTWSLETYLAIGVFLTAVIFFFALTTVSSSTENVNVEVEKISQQIDNKIIKDGRLSVSELNDLLNLNCTELKAFLDTNKEVCIYLLDADGNLITNGTHVVHGIGCDGINISGRVCGSTST